MEPSLGEDQGPEGDLRDGPEGVQGGGPHLQILPGEIVFGGQGTNYKVIRLIGEGRCGVVYSGETVNSAEPVALKFFRFGSIYTEAADREAKILGLINSTARTSVNLYAVTKHKGMICFVLELLDLNIRQLVIKNNRSGLPAWTVYKFAVDVLSCLADLHSHGFVHGDVKPANIMWSGQDGCFKCFDFGLSYHKRDSSIHSTQSVGYRAPEVRAWNLSQKTRHRNTHRVGLNNNSSKNDDVKSLDDEDNSRPGTAADVWAFGCMLAETLLGRKLFRAGDRLASVLSTQQLIEMRFDEIQDGDQDSEAHSQLKRLLVSCLEPDPSLRISAAAALGHPGLAKCPPLTKQDQILLPSPVLKFSLPTKNIGELEELINKFASFGQVVKIRRSNSGDDDDAEVADSGAYVYVQFMLVREAARAKSQLSCEGTRNLDLHHAQLEWFDEQQQQSCRPGEKQRKSANTFTTEYFPLDLWYKLKE